jgi:hypothetical protein
MQRVLLSPSRAAFKPGSSRASLSFSLLPPRAHMFLIFSLTQKRLKVMEQKASGVAARAATSCVQACPFSSGAVRVRRRCAHRDSGGGDTTAEAVAALCWTSWRRRRGEAAHHVEADFGMRRRRGLQGARTATTTVHGHGSGGDSAATMAARVVSRTRVWGFFLNRFFRSIDINNHTKDLNFCIRPTDINDILFFYHLNYIECDYQY